MSEERTRFTKFSGKPTTLVVGWIAKKTSK